MLPLFLKLAGREVVLVGGGRVAAAKLSQLVSAGARVRVVAPDIAPEVEVAAGSAETAVAIERRAFIPGDLDGAWLAVAAATPDVNREVAVAADARRIFVNAVDDPANASAFLGGVVRRDGVTVAISTSGEAPAIASLLREGIDQLLPDDLAGWLAEAGRQRAAWRRDRVPMGERKPRLLEALNQLYAPSDAGRAFSETPRAGSRRTRPTPAEPNAQSPEPSAGHVSLVGAGPGDPALLTRRAVARLRSAELVLYDALIDDRTLRFARRAQRFFVGKRAGRHAMTQSAIHNVMIRAARRGRRVVRLKGGDPFVFGRGGEEMLALQQAGVSYDVVPGVSSAIAAPALAGIPVTHRGTASALQVVTGHDPEEFAAAVAGVDAARVTLVILMGTARAARLADILMGRGWPAETPVAVIISASNPDQQVWRGMLESLAAEGGPAERSGPGTIVVGEVAALDAGGRMRRTVRKYVNG